MEVVRTSTLKLGHARTADAHAVSPAPPAGHGVVEAAVLCPGQLPAGMKVWKCPRASGALLEKQETQVSSLREGISGTEC